MTPDDTPEYKLVPAMDGLLWLLLEAGVALALLIFIVWWTMPRPKKPGDEEDGGEPR